MNFRKIPDDFLLGAATSAYQIEGAADSDGRTPSIWDVFKTLNGDNGDVACDHYNRYKEDVAIMRDLGLQAYRFSLAWPRVNPTADQTLNAPGLDFYDRLIDELLAADIEPWVTMFHWDLPLWMQEKGGWQNRDIVQRFRVYAEQCLERLGDRVKHWFTLNEPWCSAILGHQTGEHAPGLQLPLKDILNVVHNHLLTHGAAVKAVREYSDELKVGPVLNPWIPMPLTHNEDDILAADTAWTEHVGWWFEPLYKGEYPAQISRWWENDLPPVEDGDMELISQPCDFLGLNLYFPGFVRFKAEESPHQYEDCGSLLDLPRTEMGWQVYPPFLSYALERIHRFYSPGPIYITENGCALPDRCDEKGQVHDRWRQEYLRTHIEQVISLRDVGVDTRGYFAWSLLDNFEWQYGYEKRFGLVRVDYETQERTLKGSAKWYRSCLADRKLYAF